MSGFTKTFSYETEFDGDKVQFTLERLKRSQVMILAPMLEKAKPGMTEEEALDMANVFIDTLKPNVIEMKGLKDEDGNAIDIETMLNEHYFFNLASQVANELMTKSNPMKGKVGKKSKAS